MQKKFLSDQNSAVLSWWYGVIGSVISFLICPLLEHPRFPTTPSDWFFMFTHCIGGGVFAVSVLIGQQMASLLTISLALGFQVLFYFLGQHLFFNERSEGFRLGLELLGGALVMLSACMDPLHKVWTHARHREKPEDQDVEK